MANDETTKPEVEQDELASKENKEETPQPELSKEEELEIQLKEKSDAHLRLYAEFDNYKKRVAKERIELFKTAGQDVIRDLLPVLDDLNRAKQNMNDASDVEALKDGVELIINKLYTALSNKGLSAMETVNEVFDPEIHEAVTEIPAPTEEQKGKVVDELEKGYKLNDKIIRFPKVVVGK